MAAPLRAKVPPKARVKFIRDMMKIGTWPRRSRVLKHELAEKWGCSFGTVDAAASEAHRSFALDPNDVDDALETGLRRFEHLYERGIKGGKKSDLRVAMEAARTMMEIAGVDMRPERPQAAATRTPPTIQVVLAPDEDDVDDSGGPDGAPAIEGVPKDPAG